MCYYNKTSLALGIITIMIIWYTGFSIPIGMNTYMAMSFFKQLSFCYILSEGFRVIRSIENLKITYKIFHIITIKLQLILSILNHKN